VRPTRTVSRYDSPVWEPSSCLASREIPHRLWIPNAHYRVYKILLVIPILSQYNALHAFTIYLFIQDLSLYCHPFMCTLVLQIAFYFQVSWVKLLRIWLQCWTVCYVMTVVKQTVIYTVPMYTNVCLFLSNSNYAFRCYSQIIFRCENTYNYIIEHIGSSAKYIYFHIWRWFKIEIEIFSLNCLKISSCVDCYH
jgi:hypothetical protein